MERDPGFVPRDRHFGRRQPDQIEIAGVPPGASRAGGAIGAPIRVDQGFGPPRGQRDDGDLVPGPAQTALRVLEGRRGRREVPTRTVDVRRLETTGQFGVQPVERAADIVPGGPRGHQLVHAHLVSGACFLLAEGGLVQEVGRPTRLGQRRLVGRPARPRRLERGAGGADAVEHLGLHPGDLRGREPGLSALAGLLDQRVRQLGFRRPTWPQSSGVPGFVRPALADLECEPNPAQVLHLPKGHATLEARHLDDQRGPFLQALNLAASVVHHRLPVLTVGGAHVHANQRLVQPALRDLHRRRIGALEHVQQLQPRRQRGRTEPIHFGIERAEPEVRGHFDVNDRVSLQRGGGVKLGDEGGAGRHEVFGRAVVVHRQDHRGAIGEAAGTHDQGPRHEQRRHAPRVGSASQSAIMA